MQQSAGDLIAPVQGGHQKLRHDLNCKVFVLFFLSTLFNLPSDSPLG